MMTPKKVSDEIFNENAAGGDNILVAVLSESGELHYHKIYGIELFGETIFLNCFEDEVFGT